MLFKLTIGWALVATAALGVQSYRLDKSASERAVERVELAACGARLANLIEDLESDNEIDRLPDGALTTVPDHWLRPEGDPG